MSADKFLSFKNLRKQEPDEIIIDIDDRTEHGSKCVSAIGISLFNAGYWFQLWYADGMKQPHIHIPKVFNLSILDKNKNRAYKKAIYDKYIPKEYYQPLIESGVRGAIPDYSLCDPYEDKFHPIPQEGKPHHKYKTPYLMVSEFNASKKVLVDGQVFYTGQAYNFTEPEIFNKIFDEELNEKSSSKIVIIDPKTKPIFQANGKPLLFQKIAAKISLTGIADAFGLEPLGKKMRVCPFHGDSNSSLSLSDEKGLFNCFGCHVSGNIIKFYAMLKSIKPNFKYEVKQ